MNLKIFQTTSKNILFFFRGGGEISNFCYSLRPLNFYFCFQILNFKISKISKSLFFLCKVEAVGIFNFFYHFLTIPKFQRRNLVRVGRSVGQYDGKTLFLLFFFHFFYFERFWKTINLVAVRLANFFQY